MPFQIHLYCVNSACNHVFTYTNLYLYKRLYSYMCVSQKALYVGTELIVCPECKTQFKEYDRLDFVDNQSLVYAYLIYFEKFSGIIPGLRISDKDSFLEIYTDKQGVRNIIIAGNQYSLNLR